MTTEERLYRLERTLTALKGRTDLLRQELRAEIAELRREVGRINGPRQEIREFRREIRAEIAYFRQEMKAEIRAAFNYLAAYLTVLMAGLALLILTR